MTAIVYDSAVPKRKPDLYPVTEAAKLLGVGEATVWRWLRKGYLERHETPVKIGSLARATWIDLNEARKLMDSARQLKDRLS